MVGPQSIGTTCATLGKILEKWAHTPMRLARVAHMAWPKIHTPLWAYTLVWPIRPTWPSLCGPHSHTQATTPACTAHDHAFVNDTTVSHTQSSTRSATR
ncbi:hypothetical protein PVK06_041526 [Gossypium arboreum]|uniref:Uncharacterized protein n=1 Tax=Gossypium arboreum TaxID=29729 RepID=A0ABR0N8F0_GOSAR|nr:hypothetical protein PVK06_041522 [Gossypium arboreum]KAK5786876.1 hypothetical protein PVK06_041523 [Gossypium arboreum]KAK5786877.1 hypothetical protein PVK06_041524 [Gossypium arboreum]KAK5786878.1 hypothetical protein PVK06_041525 [Gossypium arboreum]KAK5786879.1 hypothetical protein PVK06_041526 [Gossypium arboreum]